MVHKDTRDRGQDEPSACPAPIAPTVSTPVAWALSYAAYGLAIFPCAANKRPLTQSGFKNASTDSKVIEGWWSRWPYAEPAWALPFNVIVADLDEKDRKHGVADFKRLEGRDPRDVDTPMATTPSGGLQLFYAGETGKTYQNKVAIDGTGIDTRSAGGYVVLPSAGNGRTWLRWMGDTPMAPAPAWLDTALKRDPAPLGLFRRALPPASGHTDRNIALRMLERACTQIIAAPCGLQDITRNTQCFLIGKLIRDGGLDYAVAYDALVAAARAMPAYGRPWRDLDVRVERSIAAGMGGEP